MKRIALIACVKQKLPHKARAEDLYTSDLFRKHLEYAKQRSPDAIYILSARYGLLPLDAEIEPYDQTLKTMSASQVRAWAQRVVEQLAQCADLRNDHFIILAGEAYYKPLIRYLSSYEIPFQGLPIGKRLQALSQALGTRTTSR